MYRVFYCIILLSISIISHSSGQKHTKSAIPCQIDSDCSVSRGDSGDVDARCMENRCEFTVAEQQSAVLKVVTRLGAKCRHNVECNIDHAICDVDFTCTCSNGTISSFSRRRCIAEAKVIGDACEEDIQCNFADTTCKAGKCECNPGLGVDHEIATQCRELNGIGFACAKDDDCEVERTQCNANRTCACVAGYSPHERECYAVSVGFLSRCDVDYQCQKALGPDAVCIREVCHCQAKHIFSVLKNRCVSPSVREVGNGAATLADAFYLLPWASALMALRNRA